MAGLVRRDYAFPFRIDPASQQTAQVSYPAHVEQMVRQLLLTSPGERVNLPQFGCGLRSLVFAPNTDALVATVKLRVIQGLNSWLGGVVNVVDVEVAGGSEAALIEPGTLAVTVTYTLVETLTNQAVTVTVA
jgi:phage baseplate assembly protein W